jgi:hypothetical protein
MNDTDDIQNNDLDVLLDDEEIIAIEDDVDTFGEIDPDEEIEEDDEDDLLKGNEFDDVDDF